MEKVEIGLETDAEFKDECDELFAKLGVSTEDAISVFLHQAVMEQAIPFRVEIKEDTLTRIVSRLPEAGRINPKTGLYVLPKDWDNPEDDVYEQLI